MADSNDTLSGGAETASTAAEGQPQQEAAPTQTQTSTPEGTKPQGEKQQTTGTEGEQKATSAPGEQAKASKAAPAEIEVKLPEGVVADESYLNGLKATAKELGLTSEGAQKFANLYVQAQAASQERMTQQAVQQVATWADEVKADKELGGANFSTTVTNARRGVQAAGGESLRQWLNQTGLGNNKHLVKAFAAFGKAMGEDSHAAATGTGSKGADTEQARHQRMYKTHFNQDE